MGIECIGATGGADGARCLKPQVFGDHVLARARIGLGYATTRGTDAYVACAGVQKTQSDVATRRIADVAACRHRA